MSRNHNVKSYGRGKHSNHPNTVVHSSIQFDKLFCENSNKPTAAKSAGTVGKWGITSFTSIRSSNFTVGKPESSSRFSSLNKKRQQAAVDSGIQNKRPVLNNNIKQDSSPVVQRKFFKSRNAADSSQKSYKSSNSSEPGTVKKSGRHAKSDENKKQKHVLFDETSKNQPIVRTIEKPLKVSTKKIPSPKQVAEEISTVDDFNKFQTLPSPPKERDKPPIVLRIFKGTSRLITEPGTKEETRDEDSFESCATSEPAGSPPPISKPLRRKSSESRSPSPEQPATKHRRNSEKSLSPETPVKVGVKRRTPDKSPAPEAEPTITTRSLRRRAASDSTSQQQQSQQAPNTSPKRVLRSTRNTSAVPPPAGKLVISNLNSDHPTVHAIAEDAPAASIASNSVSPKRKDSKECRSYGNKHKHKKEAAKVDPELKKVEQLLADLGAPVEDVSSESQNDVKPRENIDSDRQELLQLLEDDEEDGNAVSTNAVANAEPTEQPVDLQKSAEEPSASASAVIKSTESELKIKIKISDIRPSESVVEPVMDEPVSKWEPEPEPEPVPLPDSLDSGICVKNGEETSAADSMSNSCEFDSKDSFGTPDGSDFDLKNESEAPCAPIINKKGSIFKHRGSSDGNKKRLALYKHKWVDEKDAANAAEDDKNSNITKNKALDSLLDSELEDMPLTKFIRQTNTDNFDFDEPAPVTGVKCPKKTKDYYTVVRNVKRAHQIQESGEFQEFNDDVEYILDALQDNNPIGTRCLSAITLASKCTEPAFRMHVRAHGTVTKFFRTLHDATKDQSLGLCTATVMFVLSQDRLNMDLDRDSLELMLNLLESDASHTKALEDCGLTDSQLTKTREKVRQICADIQAQGHAKHLNLDNITVGHLSMETLLSLTSKRAGEWFKEELRELGGLEHIVGTIVECCKHVDETANAWSATALEKIRKVDRCLRVLENITMQNEQNNYYLLEYQDGILIDTLVKMYKVCDYEIPLYPTDSIADKDSTGAVLRECLIANLKVLINITHDYQGITRGSVVIGGTPGVIESSLHVLLQVPQYIPKEEKFDLMLLTLIMLINLVEHCDANRKAILDAKAPSDEESIFESKAKDPAVKALVAMFYNHEELARFEEKKTDAILEGENVEKPQNNAPQKVHEEFIEETISQLVQKAGQNMEHTLIAAYVAMLVGYLIIDNEEYEKFVRNHLPEKNFEFMISVLQKFYSFMTLTASGGTVSNRGMKSVQMVIQKLIESDARYGFTQSSSVSVPAISASTSSATAAAATSVQQTDKPLDLNTSSGSSSSDDKNFDALRNDSKFCESQNNANMAISAS